jgi:hypothetical protein
MFLIPIILELGSLIFHSLISFIYFIALLTVLSLSPTIRPALLSEALSTDLGVLSFAYSSGNFGAVFVRIIYCFASLSTLSLLWALKAHLCFMVLVSQI